MEARFETFTTLVASIQRCIRKIKTEEMEEFSLRYSHVSCIFYLYKEGALTATELCERCDEDKASLSRALEFLEAEGYVLCREQVQKRYRSPLELTARGRKVGRQIAEKIDRVLEAAGEGVSEEERRVMYACLAQINRNLQSLCGTYAADTTEKGAE